MIALFTPALTSAASPIGTGVASADPTAHIAAAWILSALILGGLTIHAMIQYREINK